jgi:hypothetical protein
MGKHTVRTAFSSASMTQVSRTAAVMLPRCRSASASSPELVARTITFRSGNVPAAVRAEPQPSKLLLLWSILEAECRSCCPSNPELRCRRGHVIGDDCLLRWPQTKHRPPVMSFAAARHGGSSAALSSLALADHRLRLTLSSLLFSFLFNGILDCSTRWALVFLYYLASSEKFNVRVPMLRPKLQQEK